MYRKKLTDDIDKIERLILEMGIYHHIEDDTHIGKIITILADMRREAEINRAIESVMKNGRKEG